MGITTTCHLPDRGRVRFPDDGRTIDRTIGRTALDGHGGSHQSHHTSLPIQPVLCPSIAYGTRNMTFTLTIIICLFYHDLNSSAGSVVGHSVPPTHVSARTPAEQVAAGKYGTVADPAGRARQAFQRTMTGIAADAEQAGRPDIASCVLAWIAEPEPSRRDVFLPSEKTAHLWPPKPNDPSSDAWHAQVQAARAEYSEELLKAARDAAGQNRFHACTRYLWEALHQSPAHPGLKRILDWDDPRSEKTVVSLRQGRQPQPQLDWARNAYLEGESPHFRLLTSANERDARAMLERLELWRHLWRQVFMPYWVEPPGWARSLETQAPLPRVIENRHQVVLFANRGEFLKVLARVPGIERSIGYFDPAAKRCYFYLDPNDWNLEATWRHELAHQLFQETGRHVRQPGEKANFWLLEAAAMYFESLEPVPESNEPSAPSFAPAGPNPDAIAYRWSIGGFDAARLQDARLKVLREGYWIPFATLAARGRLGFQADNDLARTYSQCAGMFHYLLHAPAPITSSSPDDPTSETTSLLPEATFRMLRQVYAGRDRADLMEIETERSLEQLEEAYRQWLPFQVPIRELAANAEFLKWASGKHQLALGFSELNDDHLRHLNAPNLIRLQLTRTQVTDQGLSELARHHHRLTALYLDATRVTDHGVAAIVRANPDLEELDLAGTLVSDEIADALKSLPQLEALWLTQTAVTDQLVATLLEMPNLQTLDLEGTQISPAQKARLKNRGLLPE